MYESYPCSRCSYHDFISCSGSGGFYLDPVEDYGTDHFHSRQSVPCGFARSLYVWCSRFFLRAYQKFLIAFVFSLLISCPAFAEDENYQFHYIGYEAMANQGMDVNQYLMDQYQEERNSEIAQILAEPLANPSLRSVNADSIFVTSSFGRAIDGSYYGTAYYDFSEITDPHWFIIGDQILSNILASGLGNNVFTYFDPLSYSNVRFVFSQYDDISQPRVWSAVTDVSSINNSDYSFTDFIYGIRSVFTWLLDHIGELITFILGNAFLSVSLLLFMCGAVISFYVRIRRS